MRQSTMAANDVDLPEPDTPVIATKSPSGMSTVTSWRLFARAPLMVSFLPSPSRLVDGTAIERSPDRYWPVSDSALSSNSL